MTRGGGRRSTLWVVTLLALAAGLFVVTGAAPVVPAAPAAADGNEAYGAPLAYRGLSASTDSACVVYGSGTLKCWGNNGQGQLGQGDRSNRGDAAGELGGALAPVDLGRPVTAVASGNDHTCALLDDGSVKCWGSNAYGTLGLGNRLPALGSLPGQMGANLPTVTLGRPATAISAGMDFTCALLDNGSVKCWGRNDFGQLGQGNRTNRGDDSGEMAHLQPVDLGTGRIATAISAGHLHACARLNNGSVKCWGHNTYGQLGVGDTEDRGDEPGEMGAALPAVDFGGGHYAAAITAGVFHTCAILNDGTVKCWGRNDKGQLGQGNTTDRGDDPGEVAALAPVQLGTGRSANGLSAGIWHTCARLNNATVKCWGLNQSGQLGLGDTGARGDGPGEMGDALPAVDLGTGRTSTAVTTGGYSSCARLDTGAYKCWGRNESGQLGQGDTAIRGDGPNEMGDNLQPIQLVGRPALTAVVSATETSVLEGQTIHLQITVTNSGTVPLHHVTIRDDPDRRIHRRMAVGCLIDPFDLSIGASKVVRCTHVAVARDIPTYQNQAFVTSDETGGLTSNVASVTVAAAPPGAVLQVAAVGEHTCAIQSGGTVKCWGYNFFGILGLGDTSSRGSGPGEMGGALPPVNLGAGRRAVALAGGGWHTCALLDDGTVKCWGYNADGELGLGDAQPRGYLPGQMGDALAPVDLGAGRTATALAAGSGHTCALLDDGSVKCWGANGSGQLGLGDTADRGDGPAEMGDALEPVRLGQGRAAVSITAGTDHTCALLDDASVKCWGFGAVLGTGSTSARGDAPGEMGDSLPSVALGSGRSATSISAGSFHTCAVLDDGTLKCWGEGDFGQLGQGDVSARGDAPGEMGDALASVNLGSGRTAAVVAAGGAHTCAQLDDGTVKCWGLNASGQLGQGDTSNRGDGPGELGEALNPVDLGAGRIANSIGAGGRHTCAVLDDATVKCWGEGTVGELGQGDHAARGDGPGEMGDALPPIDLSEAMPTSPSLTAEVRADEASVVAGDTIHLRVIVTNTGDTDLHNVTITDAAASSCEVAPFTVAEGAAHTVDCTHVATGGDVPTYTNSASVDTDETPPVSSNEEHVTVVAADPSFTVLKSVDEASVSVGQTIHYHLTIQSTGNVGLHDVDVTDAAAPDCGDDPTFDLAEGDFAVVDCEYVATGNDVGAFANAASVTTAEGGPVDSNTATVTVQPAASLVLTRVEPFVVVGTPIHYHLVLTNTTTVTLTELSIADAQAPGCDTAVPDLTQGADFHVDCTYTPAVADVGDYTNTATVDSGDIVAVTSNDVSTLVGAPVGSGESVAVAAGGTHSCAVLDSGVVKCWGRNDVGQLGLGDNTPRGANAGEMGDDLPTVDLGTGRTATAVAVGENHSCALLDDATVKCWGRNARGQLGQGDTADRGDEPDEMGDALPAVDLGAGRTALAIAAGGQHTCALLDDHTVKCWGYNNRGQLGRGSTASIGDGAGEMGDSLAAVALGTGRTATTLDAGYDHTCAVLDNGALRCWGNNAGGALGLGLPASGATAAKGDAAGEMGDSLAAVNLGTGRTAVSVSAGNLATCARLDDATVKCWGAGSSGYGDTAVRGDQAADMGDNLPAVDLGTGRTAASVTVGDSHACALLDDASSRCWGFNGTGQLGLGDLDSRGDDPGEMGDSLPVTDLGTGRTATVVTAGYAHTCAVLDDQTVKCWGQNTSGELGLGDADTRGDDPGEMGDDLPVVNLGGGLSSELTATQTADETAVTVGAAIHLHLTVTNTGGVPVHDIVVQDAQEPSCAAGPFDLAVGAVRTVDCTHLATRVDEPSFINAPGLFSNETPTILFNTLSVTVNPPVLPDAVTQVVGGAGHTCAIVNDGRVKCWGNNGAGQLGLGDTLDRGGSATELADNLPALNLGTGRTALALAAGDNHTCALLDNGSVKCWGFNDSGQLGLGDRSTRGDFGGEMGDNLPAVDLGTGRTAVAIGAGGAYTCAVLDHGELKCWGENGHGQLGVGDTADRGDAPGEMGDALPTVAVGSGRTVRQVTAGLAHTCVLLSDDAVTCWGYNDHGQLGAGDTSQRGDAPGEMGDALAPVAVGSGLSATGLTAGDHFTCALIDDAAVKCWGENSDGPLGQGDPDNRGDEPGETGNALPLVDLGTGREAVAVDAGGAHVCAILDDASIKCWGDNSSGELGLGDTDSRGDAAGEMGDALAAVDLGPGRTAVAAGLGRDHTCAVRDDDSVSCWGRNDVGQLGQGNLVNRGDAPGQMGANLPGAILGSGAPPASGVAGTVTDATTGDPVPGAMVLALRTSDYTAAGGGAADLAGDYSISLTAGTYFLYVIDRSGEHAPGFSGAPTVIHVTTGNVVDEDPAMAMALGSFTGTVTEDGTGDPVPGAVVVSLDGNTIAPGRATIADGAGAYTLGSMAPHRHFLAFLDPTGAHRSEFHLDANDVLDATKLLVRPGAATTGNASMARQTPTAGGAVLDGTVTEDGSADPLEGVLVVALNAADFTLARAATTDADGRYLLDVAAGDYRVIYLDTVGVHEGEWATDHPFYELPQADLISAPGTVDAALAVQKGSISGTVTDDASGDPVVGACVFAIDGQTMAGAITAADGSYSITGLAENTYRLVVVDPAGAHATEFWDDSATFVAGHDIVVGSGASVAGVDAALTPVLPP